MTNFTPDVLVWLSSRLRDSHLTRDDLITLIIVQNIIFLACVAAGIAVWHGRGWLGSSPHKYLEPNSQPVTEPIAILVTKVVTVQTEEIVMRPTHFSGHSAGASADHGERTKLLPERKNSYGSEQPMCQV